MILSTILTIVFFAAFLVLTIVGAIKEHGIRQRYAGVFGRVAAFFSLYLFVGVFMFLIPLFSGNIAGAFINLLVGCIGFIPVFLASKNCPEPLKKGLVWNMIVAGAGVNLRVALRIILFFLPFAAGFWPSEVTTATETYEREQEYYDKNTGTALQSNSDGSHVKVNGEWVKVRDLDSDNYDVRDK